MKKYPNLDEEINNIDNNIVLLTNEWKQTEVYNNLKNQIDEYSNANEKEKKYIYADYLATNSLINMITLLINDTKKIENKPIEIRTTKENELINTLLKREEELVSLKEKQKKNIVGKLGQELESSKPNELTNKEKELKSLNLLVIERDGLNKTLKSLQNPNRSLEKSIKTSGGKKEIKRKITKHNNKISNKLTKKIKKVRFHKSSKKLLI